MMTLLLVTLGSMWLFAIMVAGVVEVFSQTHRVIEQGFGILSGEADDEH